ncbi:MAG: glycosyltransferase family 4 protein, partial [Desulfurococcales archaeon]|nr:glycosyltransferase family 4 protein [Desulfurococcales archaeon]
NKLSNILNNFSYIIVHNKYSYNKLLSTYGNHLSSKTVIIPHGSFSLYYNTSYNLNDIKLFRQQYNIPEDAFVYGFFGSIRMYKGVDLLVEAFNRISKNYNDVYLLVCGNDNNRILEKYKYNNSCSKCIFRLEYIPDDRVRSCIIPFDVAVVPYRVVYTPGSAILYASFKKPIITSRIPVMLETLDGNAIYHAPEDLDSLVEAMIYAYEDRDKLNVLAERAFNAVERYSWREIAMSTIKLYNGLDS